jgi:hypothetical protein
MTVKSLEAKRILRELDKELAAASERCGQQLVWSAQDSAVLAQLSSVLDRKAELVDLYDDAKSVKNKLLLSREIRLLEQSSARLVQLIKTDLAPAESMTTRKARRAAQARWDRSPGAAG